MSEITQDSLFNSFRDLEVDLLALKERIKEVKDAAKEAGFEAKLVGRIQKCAKIDVADLFDERTFEERELEALYKELTGYDDDEPKF